MRLIVYFEDGALEEHANHAAIVASGAARYATAAERRSYERNFEEDDAHGRMEPDELDVDAFGNCYSDADPGL